MKPFFEGIQLHIDYYIEYVTGKVIIAAGFSYYKYWTKSITVGKHSGLSVSLKAGIGITASFASINSKIRLKKVAITLFAEIKGGMKAKALFAVLYDINVSGRFYGKLVIDLYNLLYKSTKSVIFDFWVGVKISARVFILGFVDFRTSYDRSTKLFSKTIKI